MRRSLLCQVGPAAGAGRGRRRAAWPDAARPLCRVRKATVSAADGVFRRHRLAGRFSRFVPLVEIQKLTPPRRHHLGRYLDFVKCFAGLSIFHFSLRNTSRNEKPRLTCPGFSSLASCVWALRSYPARASGAAVEAFSTNEVAAHRGGAQLLGRYISLLP